MRKATQTCIAASVALAMAGAAHAITARPAGSPGVSTPFVMPATTGAGSGTGTTTGSTGTGTTSTGTTSTGTTAQGFATTPANTTSTGSTAGVSQVGTSTGSALIDAQNSNLAAQFDTRGTTATSQSETTATAAVNGTTVGTTTAGSTTTSSTPTSGDVFGRGAGVIITDNGTGTAGIVNNMTANGERLATSVDMSSLSPNAVEAPAIAIQPAAPALVASEVNVLERRELYKRRNVKRDRQLLYSIAPRTGGASHADEMPNDPVSPALTPPF